MPRKPKSKIHRKRYVCTLCTRHHGAYTKIGGQHRKYARPEREVAA